MKVSEVKKQQTPLFKRGLLLMRNLAKEFCGAGGSDVVCCNNQYVSMMICFVFYW